LVSPSRLTSKDSGVKRLENYYPGLAAAGGIHLFGHVANINFSYRIGYALIALSLNALYNMYRVQPIFNTIQFLDYTTQARVARSRAEIETGEGKTYLLENAASFKGLQNKAGLTDIKQAYRELFAL
jgi:hypothetical protein